MRTLVYVMLWMFVGHAPALAGDVSFQVSAPQSVAEGERFRVTWTLDARPDDFSAPSFEGFRRISGPSTSSSTSTQIINNQVTTTVSYSYTFVLEALEQGTFTIPPATAVIDGQEHASETARVEVSDTPADPRQPQDPRQPDTAQTQPGPDDIFIRAEISNTSPFRGEEVIVSYKLYTRLSVQRYNIERLPGFQGLWTENITPSGQPAVTREELNGQIYQVAEIRRMAVFPQRSGEITIEAMEVEATVRMPGQDRRRPGSIFDDFFGGSPFDRHRTVSHPVRAEPVVLNVQPLPSAGQPDDFTGLVGQFGLEASLDARSIDVNDAATLQVTLSGEGNIRMAELPEIGFPQQLDVFDPQVSDDVQKTRSGIRGSRTFDYVIIARATGEFDIPEVRFSYFDPERRAYRTATSGPFQLQVEGEPAVSSHHPGGTLPGRWLADDIRFIHTGAVSWQQPGEFFYRSTRFFLLVAIPILLLVVFLLVWSKHRRNLADIQGLRMKKAQKVAVKRLKRAKGLLRENSKEAFFEEIFRALWGYVSDRLDMPVSRLNKENVATAFASRQISPELAARFLEGLYDCEYARFAPAGDESPMNTVYNKALDTIVAIEKEFKKNTWVK